ncbi:MAG: hypothetical protein ACU0C9_08365 [Paracoccaceae bacterium]
MQPVSQGLHAPPSRAPQAPPPSETNRPGNSAQSVGHRAKAAIAAAHDSGVEVPKNAQGVAASQIASGADPATLFAAISKDEPEAPDIGPQGADEPVETLAQSEQPAAAAPLPDKTVDSSPPPDPATQIVTDAEAALELLTGDPNQET